jgi:hypothetical protein
VSRKEFRQVAVCVRSPSSSGEGWDYWWPELRVQQPQACPSIFNNFLKALIKQQLWCCYEKIIFQQYCKLTFET